MKRPAYRNLSTQSWTRNIALANGGGGSPHIYIESSNIAIAGAGEGATTIYGGPDGYIIGQLAGIGSWRSPAYSATSYPINTVNRGDTSITLQTASNASHFAVGDDAMLFFGSVGTGVTCVGAGSFPGCNWVESNPITSIDSTNGILYLKYAANKTYYSDGVSPFGVVDVPETTQTLPNLQGFRHLAFHDFTWDSPNGLIWAGFGTPVSDVSIYNVNMPTGATAPLVYSAFGRNWNIHDNRITLGNGTANFGVQEELDRTSDWSITNNVFKANSALSTLGTFLNYGFSLTEGTSNITFTGNKLYGVSIGSDCGSNGIAIVNNLFFNAELQLGQLVSPDLCNVGSFGTPAEWNITGNNFFGMTQASGCLVYTKNVAHGVVIGGNTLDGRSTDTIGADICAASGSITSNTIHVVGSAGGGNYGIQLYPQGAGGVGIPALPISVTGNTITGGATFSRGIEVVDPGATWNGLITISGNVENVNNVSDYVPVPADTPNVNDSNTPSQLGAGANPAWLLDQGRSPLGSYSGSGGSAIYTCNSLNAGKEACVTDGLTACTVGTTYAAAAGSTKCKVMCDSTWKYDGFCS